MQDAPAATCRLCSATFTRKQRGRPRFYCESCSKTRKREPRKPRQVRLIRKCRCGRIILQPTIRRCSICKALAAQKKRACDHIRDRRRARDPKRIAYHNQLMRGQTRTRRLIAAAAAIRAAENIVHRPALPPAPQPPPIPAGHRVCLGQCGRTLPLSDFHGRNFKHSRCKTCQREQRYGRRVFIAGRCLECDNAFVTTTPRIRFCDQTCARRYERRNSKWKRTRRIKSAGHRDPIGLPTLAKRDGWKCHLCRLTVTRKTWSIDHLIPLSDGGQHTWDNVALAHHRCNSLRGATGQAQLRLSA